MDEKITALRPFVLDSQRVQAGDTITVSSDEKRALLYSGAAVAADDSASLTEATPNEPAATGKIDSDAKARTTKPDTGPTETK